MLPERWQLIDQLFHLALEQEPKCRAAFLAQKCSGDASLVSEIEELISSHEQARDFIETPAADIAAELLAGDQAALVVGQSVGPYEIVSVLGAGGMGEVYLAMDLRLGRHVALKLLPGRFTINAERVRRFEQEARAVSALNHPNIVTIHEIGHDGEAQFIVTEFVDGETLRQRMKGTATLRLTLDVAVQVAGALAAAHTAGIVHRDIKPENIMLRTDGYVKVLDFGLAKLAESQFASHSASAATLIRVQTNSGLVMGTATYMSPEQARGLDVDPRSDIFSLGIVIYEMLTGYVPFDGPTTSDVVVSILEKEQKPLKHYLPEVPAELEWIIRKALAKDCDERYQEIKELQIDLRRLKQALELQAKLDGLAPAGLHNATVSSDSGVNTKGRRDESGNESGSARMESGRFGAETKSHERRFVPGVGALAAVATVAIFSLVSFYVGLKQITSVSQPTFRQLTFRRGAIDAARFSADGQTLIYSAAFDGKPLELFTNHLESPESSSLKLNANIQSISSSGEMAVLLDCELDGFGCHNGTLARVPLVGGTPREIMEHVYAADWGPDGQELAVVCANDDGQFQLEYPIGTILYKAPGRIGALRVSPKGDVVAFVDQPTLGDTGGAIMVVNRDGQKRTLSDGWKSVGGLAWSPTGEEVWFAAGKGRVNALHAVTLSGRSRLVFQAPGNVGLKDISRNGKVLIQRGILRSRMIVSTLASEKERDLAWFDWSTSADISTDGKTLLFYEWGTAVGGAPSVYLRKMDGSNDPVRLGPGKALALSPDGKWALALQESPTAQLTLLPTGPGQARLLTRGNIAEYHFASWFPDGQKILFTAMEPGQGLRSFVQDISEGPPQSITEEGIIALMVSPDGKRFVAWTADDGPDGKYYLSSIDGADSIPIPGLEMGETPLRWSSDGRALYIRGAGDFTTSIYRIDLSRGRRELRKEIVPDQTGFLGFEVRRDIQITPDGKSYAYTYWTALRDVFLAEGLK